MRGQNRPESGDLELEIAVLEVVDVFRPRELKGRRRNALLLRLTAHVNGKLNRKRKVSKRDVARTVAKFFKPENLPSPDAGSPYDDTDNPYSTNFENFQLPPSFLDD